MAAGNVIGFPGGADPGPVDARDGWMRGGPGLADAYDLLQLALWLAITVALPFAHF